MHYRSRKRRGVNLLYVLVRLSLGLAVLLGSIGIRPMFPLFPLTVAHAAVLHAPSLMITSCEAVTWVHKRNVTATSNTIEKTAGGNGWNAGAASSVALQSGSSGYVEATVASASDILMFGLSRIDSNANWTSLNYGFYIDPNIGGLAIVESGSSRGNFGTYAAGDVLRIAADSTGVRYYRNGSLLYTSTVTPTYPLSMDSSIYNQGAKVQNAQICGASAPPPIPSSTCEAVTWAHKRSVVATSNTIQKTAGGNSWNAGATSSTAIQSGNRGYVRATVASLSDTLMFGLAHRDTNTNWTSLDYAFYIDPAVGYLSIVESGTNKASWGMYDAGDELTIAVDESGVVRYYYNGQLVYTSIVAPTYPLYMDSSIWNQGGKVQNAQICGATTHPILPQSPCESLDGAWTGKRNVTATGNTITKTSGGNSWNAGGASKKGIASGRGYAQMTIASLSDTLMFGLSHFDANLQWQSIDYAFYIDVAGSQIIIEEKGVNKGSFGLYDAGDILRVAVDDTQVVRYYKNGELLYTSTAAPIYPLFLDSSLWGNGSKVQDAYICGASLTQPTSTSGCQATTWTNGLNVSATGNTLVKTGGGGWNAGAVSNAGIPQGSVGYVRATVASTQDILMVGLSDDTSNNVTWQNLDYAFYIDPNIGGMAIEESGIWKASAGLYDVGDELAIGVDSAGVVRYYRNGMSVYTSTVAAPSVGLFMDTSIYNTGGTVQDAYICNGGLPGVQNVPVPREIAGAGSPSQHQTTCSSDQPVNCVTGNFWHAFTDLLVPGKGVPLQFSRTYNTQNAGEIGSLGYGWTHNYDMYITQDQSGNYLVHEENGSIAPFGSNFSHPLRVMATLTNTNGAYIFTRTHSEERFFFRPVSSTLRLSEIVDRTGLTTTLSYQNGLLRTVTDPVGRSLTFTYTNGLLTSIGDPANRSVTFGYTGSNLTASTDVSGQGMSFSYDGNHRMLSMTDPLDRALVNVYDSASRVISQTDFISNTLQFGYTSASTRMTDTLGVVTTYDHATNMLRGESRSVGYQQQPPEWTYFYQTNTSWVTSETDPMGRTWRYTWDQSGNKTRVTDPLTNTTYYTYTTLILPTGDNIPLPSAQQDALGRVTRFGYNSLGHTIAITNTLNQVSQFEYNTAGQVVRTTDPGGVSECREYDTSGNLTAVMQNCVSGGPSTPSQNIRTEYGYDTLGRRTWERNALGEVTRSFYDANGYLVKTVVGCAVSGSPSTGSCDNFTSTAPEVNRTALYGYDTIGRPMLVTDTLGTMTRTEYDVKGRPYKQTRNYVPGGPVDETTNVATITEYDTYSRMSAGVDPLGRRSVPQYDTLGRQIGQVQNYIDGNPATGTSDSDLISRTGYNDIDLPITSTVNYVDGVWNAAYPDQDVSTVTRYDVLNRPITIIENYVDGVASQGEVETDRITTYLYDAVGNRVATTSPDGRVVVTVQDGLSRTVEEIRNCTDGNGVPRTSNCATGHGTRNDENIRTSMTYNARGQLETRTDALGRVSRTSYDALGRVTQQVANESGAIDPINVTTQYAYDALGHTLVITDALGGVQSTEYNTAGWVTRQTDPTSRWVDFTYDGLGRRTMQTDMLDRETRTIYDGLGRPKKTVANWQNGVVETGDPPDVDLTTEIVYDAAGRKVAQIRPDGQRTNFTLDGLDRLGTVVENASGTVSPSNVTTHYGYDRRGLLTNITDPLNHQKTRAYNAAGWQIEETDALTRTVAYGYDRMGRRVSVDDQRPTTVSYAYDYLGRITSISAPNFVTVTLAYDHQGRRTQMSDQTGTTTYAYDGLDRLTGATHSVDGTVSSGYDLLGRRTSLNTNTGAPTVSYEYDAAGRLLYVNRNGSTADAGAQYDSLGRLSSITQTNGLVTTYGYDGVSRTSQLTTTVGAATRASFNYSIGRGGQVAVLTETVGLDTRSVGYSYDGLHRLTGATEAPGSVYTYTYDLAGNRTQVSANGSVVETRTYDAADQVSSTGWQYDGAGNLLTDGTNTYTYDALKRQASVTVSSTTTLYGYNGDGILATQTSGGTTTRYTLDTTGGLPDRLGVTTGITSTWYVRGWGQELRREEGSVSTWFLPDRLGSVRALVDNTGAITASYNYDPFGTPQGMSQPQDYGFTGEPHGINSTNGSLVYLRTRWYNTGAGRFITHDPKAGQSQQPMSYHYYLYSYNDPINRIDPTGLASRGCLSPRAISDRPSDCELMIESVRDIMDSNAPSDVISWLIVLGQFQLLNNPHYIRDQVVADIAFRFADIPYTVSGPVMGLSALGLPQSIVSGVVETSLNRVFNSDYRTRERYDFLVDLDGNGRLESPFDPHNGNYGEWLDAGNVRKAHVGDKTSERNSVDWVKRRYPHDVLTYGFKDNYWSNSHHFYAMFLFGYGGQEMSGFAVGWLFEKIAEDNPTDYAVGERGATLGAQFRAGQFDFDTFPEALRSEMCLNDWEKAILYMYDTGNRF